MLFLLLLAVVVVPANQHAPSHGAMPRRASGRNRLPSDHVMKVYCEIQGLARTLRSMLCAPTVTRARHFHTAEGQRERRIVQVGPIHTTAAAAAASIYHPQAWI
jgi:hypothetical protein